MTVQTQKVDVASIAARIKLTAYSAGMWRATRLHKSETRAENERHKTDVAKVTVRLTDNENLKKLTALHAAAYAEHKRLTLPTDQAGMRMLPAGRELEHSQRMTEFHDSHEKIVDAFLSEYDQERLMAPIRLNGLFDASMWPSHDTVASKFKFTTRYLACPTDGSWAQWIEDSTAAARDDVDDRIRAALERVRDRCRSEGPLYATVFDNLRELKDLLPDLDLDGTFTAVTDELGSLTKLHAENLRDDKQGREDVAQRASDILSVLGRIK